MWASVACFAVEYVCLFAGVSLFFRGLNAFYTLLHFLGAILVALFYMRARLFGGFVEGPLGCVLGTLWDGRRPLVPTAARRPPSRPAVR